MKKYINISMYYFILASIAGVFYREFTKFNNFTGKTSLSIIHTHLFSLGMIMFLIIALFVNAKNVLSENKNFKRFIVLYNLGVVLFTLTLLVRGILQVKMYEISRALNYSISGIAGISHIFLTVSLVLFFMALRKEFE